MLEHLRAIELTESERQLATQVDAAATDRLLPMAQEWGERSQTSRELVEAMADEGLFAVTIPKEYGGHGRDIGYGLSLCLTREVLGYHSPTLDISYALQGLGTGAIVRLGTAEQKARYLPDLVAGRTLFSFGLTEPEAGSDVMGMSTTSRGVEGGHVVNGRKMFISGAPDADVYVVFARSGEQPRSRAIDALIIEKGTEGFTPRGDLELAAPHAIGYLDLDEVFVPEEARIGATGEGLAASLGTLEIYRPSVGAFAVGAGARAWDLARDFAAARVVFDKPLAQNAVIRGKLAATWAALAAARALVYRAARENDAGRVSAWRSGIAKLAATETAIAVTHEAQQIHGGRGVIAGAEVEVLVRALRPTAIYEGTSEIQRTIIGRVEAKRAPGHREEGSRVPTVDDLGGSASARMLALAAKDLVDCEAAMDDALGGLAAAPDALRSQVVRLRLADARVAVESVRELVLGGARLVRSGDPAAHRLALAAAIVGSAARLRVGRELLELDRHERCGDREAMANLLMGHPDRPGLDDLHEELAQQLLDA